METSPELEFSLRERDRVAYSLRKILKPFQISVAFANPGPSCVELCLRSPPPPEFSQAAINFLAAHSFRVFSTSDGFLAHRIAIEDTRSVKVQVTFSLPTEQAEFPIIRIEGMPHAA